MAELNRRADAPAFAPTSMTLLALGALAAIVLGLGTLSSAARQANEREARDERQGVIEAVQDQRRATMAAVARLAAKALPTQALPAQAQAAAPDLGLLDEAYLLQAGDAPPVTRLTASGAAPASLDPAAQDLTRALSAGSATEASGMLAVGGDLLDAAALPLGRNPDPAAASRPIVLGLRHVETRYLAGIARRAGVRGLQLSRLADDGGQGGAVSVQDWGGFGLTWQPARPGDGLMLRWTAALVAITAVVAVLIIWRARHFAGQLQSSEARAVAASNNDWLSGLPNRVFFNHMLERELQSAKTRRTKLALFYLDVDHFGEINDTFGIAIGDRMIRAVTERIAAVIQEARLVARFEGDSFMILLPGVADAAACERLALDLQTAMKPPFDLDGTRVTASASIGVALAPDDATECNEMIRLANLALHRAKRDGRNRLAFYKPELDAEWRRRTSTERELRAAIAHEGLVLRYQPIVGAESGAPIGVEALVRWQHPTEGLIAPDRFIGLAEDRGLILPLGEWVMREACRAAVNWPALRVAVNVSPIQLRQRDFVALVDDVLRETGLHPARLELELTEGILVDHEAENIDAMAQLRARGIRLALDDFGTGYSSLIYLRRFAIDKIKIDKAFIEALEPGSDGAILLDGIVKLGRALGLTITAEGIETDDQRRFLAAAGCQQLQGYLISKPLPAEDILGFAGIPALRHTPSSDLAVRGHLSARESAVPHRGVG